MVELFFIRRFGDSLAMELQTTLNTVCHDSIISYLVSRSQMLSSAKPNWFAAEMKGWQSAIHHRFCRDQRCLHLYETSEYVCVCDCICVCGAWGAAKWKANKQLETDADSLVCGWPARVRCVCVQLWMRGRLSDWTLYLNQPNLRDCVVAARNSDFEFKFDRKTERA